MFCLFVDNKLLDFWSNKPGDIFIENTILKLNLDKQNIDLCYYEINVKPDFFEFDEDKNLLIKKKLTNIIEKEIDGEIIKDEEITYEIDNTIASILYYSKGTMLKSC